LSARVAVTGVGAVTPYGVGAEPLLAALVDGINPEGVVNGGRCAGFDPKDYLSRKEIQRNSRFGHLALVAAIEAMNQSGMSGGLPYGADRLRCVIGSGLGGVEIYDQPATPMSVPMLMPSSAAAAISMRFGIHGEVYGVSTACASGNHAIGAGYRAIRYEGAPAAIVGASEAVFTDLVQKSFETSGVLASGGRCAPFAVDSEGFVMSEGAGVLVLENYELAALRGAPIIGFVIGYGASAEAHTVTGPYPGGRRTAIAMRRALADSGISSGDIAFIKAHGTGTAVNDNNEVQALREVFGDGLRNIPLCSLKGQLGHLLGASGAVEAIVALCMLNAQTVVATTGSTDNQTATEYAAVVRERHGFIPRGRGGAALCNAFGFGGQNASVILGSAEFNQEC
jgi:3-oxoacyl-[acyl-carrier-protein] synthase II